MAAVPSLVVGESPFASPELALVDATLAAELRRSLSSVEDSWLRPPSSEEDPGAIEEDGSAERDFGDDPGEAETGDAENLYDYEYIVEAIEQTPTQSQRTTSHYPVLPALEPEDELFQ